MRDEEEEEDDDLRVRDEEEEVHMAKSLSTIHIDAGDEVRVFTEMFFLQNQQRAFVDLRERKFLIGWVLCFKVYSG